MGDPRLADLFSENNFSGYERSIVPDRGWGRSAGSSFHKADCDRIFSSFSTLIFSLFQAKRKRIFVLNILTGI